MFGGITSNVLFHRLTDSAYSQIDITVEAMEKNFETDVDPPIVTLDYHNDAILPTVPFKAERPIRLEL
jgi:hypothetical protein